MPSFKITLAYDGTGFVGWQRQASGTSVQGLLEDALRELDERDVAVIGAGRTDAGVHALGQVAGFSLARAIAPETVVRALNARLPPAVRVLEAAGVPDTFHARFHARAKTYRYRLWTGEVVSPFERDAVWQTGALDVEQMAAAARVVVGRHDFAAFQGAGGVTRTTEREVFSSRMVFGLSAEKTLSAKILLGGELVTYEITGNGFLRHMVRNIVGTLVEVGRGRHPAAWVGEVLASRDRAQAGPTAPAAGLFLVSVEY